MRAVASGGRFLASRPKKPHRGFFPRSFIATRRTAVRLWLRARSRGDVGVPPLPPARSVSLAFVRRSVCAQGARCFSPCAPLCCSLARSVACFGSLRSVGLAPALLSLRRSFALYTSRCLAPAVPPCLPLCRSRSASGGSRRRPLRGLRLGWARSSPPAAYKAAPIVAGWRVRVKPCFFPTPPALAPRRGGATSVWSGVLLINAALIKNEIIARRISVVIDENTSLRKLSEAVRKENTLFTIHSFFTSIHSRVTLLTRECIKKCFIVCALLHT